MNWKVKINEYEKTLMSIKEPETKKYGDKNSAVKKLNAD